MTLLSSESSVTFIAFMVLNGCGSNDVTVTPFISSTAAMFRL